MDNSFANTLSVNNKNIIRFKNEIHSVPKTVRVTENSFNKLIHTLNNVTL